MDMGGKMKKKRTTSSMMIVSLMFSILGVLFGWLVIIWYLNVFLNGGLAARNGHIPHLVR